MIQGFLWVATWIWSFYVYLSMFFYVFSPFAKQSQAEVVACWRFWCELKALNESKYSMSWVCCAFGNVFLIYHLSSLFWKVLDIWFEKIFTLWRPNCWKYLELKIEVCRMGPLFIIIWHYWTGGNFLNQNHIILHGGDMGKVGLMGVFARAICC